MSRFMPTAEDRQKITAVIQRYAVCFDTRDTEGVLGCFTDDVHLDYLDGLKVVDGVDQVRATMFGFGSVPLPGVDRILHSHHAVRVDQLEPDASADGAVMASRTSCIAHLVVEGADGTLLLTRAVQYDDLHRRTTSGWRIASRRHSQLWEARQPARDLT